MDLHSIATEFQACTSHRIGDMYDSRCRDVNITVVDLVLPFTMKAKRILSNFLAMILVRVKYEQ